MGPTLFMTFQVMDIKPLAFFIKQIYNIITGHFELNLGIRVWRFSCIGSGRKWGSWKYHELNHLICCWEPLGIGFVGSGNHSLVSGIVEQEGKLESCEVLNIKNFYEHIFCDGEYYYFRNNSKNKKICKVQNIDFAIIYEMGRMLNERDIKYWN